jgi:hypothetical protein
MWYFDSFILNSNRFFKTQIGSKFQKKKIFEANFKIIFNFAPSDDLRIKKIKINSKQIVFNSGVSVSVIRLF